MFRFGLAGGDTGVFVTRGDTGVSKLPMMNKQLGKISVYSDQMMIVFMLGEIIDLALIAITVFL
jgi:hypothetical protein